MTGQLVDLSALQWQNFEDKIFQQQLVSDFFYLTFNDFQMGCFSRVSYKTILLICGPIVPVIVMKGMN